MNFAAAGRLALPVLLATLGPSVVAAVPQVYWIDADGPTVRRANLDGSSIQDVAPTVFNTADVAFDPAEGYVYYSAPNNPPAIRRCLPDGTSDEVLVALENDTLPCGLALDHELGKIYWTERSANRVRRANLDGTQIETVIPYAHYPFGVALDPAGGRVYWTEQYGHRIGRANLDGSAPEEIVAVTNPYDVELDLATGRLYWTTSTGYVQRAPLDGGAVETVVDASGNLLTFLHLDPYLGKMYWGDYSGQRIQRANLDGTGTEIVANVSAPYGIVATPTVWPQDAIYFTDYGSDRVRRVRLDGSDAVDLVTTGLSLPQGVATDPVHGKMYWCDAGTDRIQRADLDGAGVEDVVSGLQIPDGLIVCPITNKLYWTDRGTDRIQCSDLDGSNVQDLVTTGLSSVSGIAIDPLDVKLYWAENAFPGSLHRADLDGTNVETLPVVTSHPAAVAIDVAGRALYWTEAGKVRRSALDGSAPADLVTGLGLPRHLEIDHASSRLLWTDDVAGKIQSCALDGTQLEDLVAGLVSPYGLALGPASETATSAPDVARRGASGLVNTPNPFRASTTLRFAISSSRPVSLTVHDVAGRRIRTLTRSEPFPAGEHAVVWDGRDDAGRSVAAGVYFVSLGGDARRRVRVVNRLR
ncbi:MAG: FlgD immunoglobulin-like domain containing protein [bacterium]